jgi:hypothetical protein
MAIDRVTEIWQVYASFLVMGVAWACLSTTTVGAASLAVLLPLAYFVLRHHPEGFGLNPDGAGPGPTEVERVPAVTNLGYNPAAECIRRPRCIADHRACRVRREIG